MKKLTVILAFISVAVLFLLRYLVSPTLFIESYINIPVQFLAGEILGSILISLFIWWVIEKIFTRPKPTETK